MLFLFKTHDHGMVHFQKGIFNANTDYTSMIISTSHNKTFMIFHTLIIGASAVYQVAFILLGYLPSSQWSDLGVRVTPDRPGTP